jgi:hypothetical protein
MKVGRINAWLVGVLVGAGLMSPLQAKIIRVAHDGPADFNTIQAAIDDANDGDTVLVGPGTYTGDGNRDIDFRGKAITVKGEQGAETTIIDCEGSADKPHRGFYVHSAEDANSILCGFTIRNGYTLEYGGAIFCWMVSPHIMSCVFTGCTAVRGGGGIATIYSGAVVDDCIVIANQGGPGGGILSDHEGDVRPPIFTRCIVAGNQARGGYGGGGVYLDGDATFINCTICDNRVLQHDLYGGGLYCGHARHNKAVLRNCIVWGNTASRGSEIAILGDVGILGIMSAVVEYSLIGTDPNSILDVDGQILGDWLRADPLLSRRGYWDANGTPDNRNDDFFVQGDYHLKSQAGRWDPLGKSWVMDNISSPCIDAGDPNSPIGYEPFPNGGRINIGAYGGTGEAGKSYFGGPVCETIIAGDINGDCKVDRTDLAILVGHWLEDGSGK